MAILEGSHDVEVSAPPERVFDLLTDYERLPSWQGPLLACRVGARYPDGLAEVVTYEVDMKLRRISYTVRHTYERPRWIGSEYLSGDLACFEGEWTIVERGAGSHARLAMRIDPGFPVPGRLARMAQRKVLERSVDDLARELER